MFFPVLGGEHIFEVLYNLVMMSDLHVFFMDLWILGSYKLGIWAKQRKMNGHVDGRNPAITTWDAFETLQILG